MDDYIPYPEFAEVRVRDGVGERFNERSGGVFSLPNERKYRSPLAAWLVCF